MVLLIFSHFVWLIGACFCMIWKPLLFAVSWFAELIFSIVIVAILTVCALCPCWQSIETPIVNERRVNLTRRVSYF